MKKVFLFLFVIMSISFSCKEQGEKLAERPKPKEENKPVALAPQPFGINLSGAEFGPVNIPGIYNRDYTYPTNSELDYFKSKGLRLIRFPFKWERIQRELKGPLDAMELARMKAFVSAAESRGLPLILDMHNYGRRKVGDVTYLIGTPEVSIEDVVDVWAKLAQEFKSYNNIWGYGLMNEPWGMLSTAPWFNIAQELITEIRTIDSKTTILIGGDDWSSAARWVSKSNNLKELKDPSNNLIYEAHVYFDNNSSGSYQDSYEIEKATPTIGVERVTPFVNWLKAHKLRGFVGEYGVPDDDPRWLVTLDNMLKYLKDNCVNGTYWSAGPWWGAYKLAVEPKNITTTPIDRPQMEVLTKHLITDPNNCK